MVTECEECLDEIDRLEEKVKQLEAELKSAKEDAINETLNILAT